MASTKRRENSESSDDIDYSKRYKSVIGLKVENVRTREEVVPEKKGSRYSRERKRSRSKSRSYERHRRHRESKDDARKQPRSRSHERPRRRRQDSEENPRKRPRRSRSYERPRSRDQMESKQPRENKSPPQRKDDDENYWVEKRTKSGLKNALVDNFLTKTGGAYIPPARLRMMQAQITDKSSAQYQRIAWEALKKSIHGLINKVTASNIVEISRELFQENIVRGRGLLVKSLVQAQSVSLTFTSVFAALVAVVNSKFPQIGVLLLNRLILQFKRGYKRNIKTLCFASTHFIAHLYNQKVVDEIILFEILILLLEKPTDDSVEVAVGFLKECGQKLTVDSPTGILSIFDSLRTILSESKIDIRVMYMIEVIFAIRKDGYKDHLAVSSDLEIVEDEEQFTHRVTLEDEINAEDHLNVFKLDSEYEVNEDKYKSIRDELLGEGNSDEEEDEEDEEVSGNEDAEEGEEKTTINDQTETNLITLRRTIYLTIQSSLDYEECAHKLLKMQLKPGQESEVCYMILDCAAQQRTYEKFFGLLAQRFCMIDKKYIEPYQRIFKEQYDTVHRLETNKLRNVAKFFGHLFFTDAVSWEVMECIKLNEDDTTSSSRIFIKILFQELSEFMGLAKLNDRLKDSTLQTAFEGIFPRNNPRDTRFSINFFTSIGLGGLTDELRNHLKSATAAAQKATRHERKGPSGSSSSED